MLIRGLIKFFSANKINANNWKLAARAEKRIGKGFTLTASVISVG